MKARLPLLLRGAFAWLGTLPPWLLPAAALLALGTAGLAEARPGGGHSYSGGGGSSSGGGSYGGGGGGGVDIVAIFYLIQFLFQHPLLLLILIVIGVIWYFVQGRAGAGQDWSAGDVANFDIEAYQRAGRQNAPAPRPSHARGAPRRQLLGLQRQDPDFSIVVFEDFVYALYAKAHVARGAQQLEGLLPYLSPAARETLARHGSGLQQVQTVVIGAMRYRHVSVPQDEGHASVEIEFEANYTEVPRAGAPRTFYAVERWVFGRPTSARSKPPEEAVALGCPNCGAPLTELRGEVCGYCDTRVDQGGFDWMVQTVNLVNKQRREPQLTGTVDEAGTNLPTVRDPEAAGAIAALKAQDPAFSEALLKRRIDQVYHGMNTAWSELRWPEARPYLSDELFKMVLYWIETYKAAGLANLHEDARIDHIELVRVTTDKYYAAVTARVFASGLDYTVDGQGHVVGGSAHVRRSYSEYWTLIRGVGVTGGGDGRPNCPNCGAPLNINMTGNCNHCQARITTGAFDWVLSRIEQDESYQP